MNVTFSDQIDQFEEALSKKREQLEELKEKRTAYSDKIVDARRALEALRAALRGEAPPDDSGDATVDVAPLKVNTETDRPSRGARRQQIIDICEAYGRKTDTFHTHEIVKELKKIEGSRYKESMESYTYALMNKLGKDDDIDIKKVGRGEWKWTGR